MTNTGNKVSNYLICTQSAFTMSAMILAAMSVMGFFRLSQRTVLVGYFTTLSQQMLTAIKHVADEKFLFSAGQHTGTPCMQRVKLQESERSSSLLLTTAFNLSAQQWSPLIMRFRGSHNSTSSSCKSELKKLSSDWLKFHEVATALEWKDAIFVFLFHNVVQRHCLGEVEK